MATRRHAPAPALESESWDDPRLVQACIAGDEDAWATLIGRYRRLIFSIPIRYGAQPDEAGDIFQAVCLELFAELPRLRNVASLKSWLMTVTGHQAYHWKQRRQRRQLHESEPVDGDLDVPAAEIPSDILQATEREQVLRDSIVALSPRCRELIELLFYSDPPVPYAEAARRLGLAAGSIGFIRGRCLKKLQQALGDRGFRP